MAIIKYIYSSQLQAMKVYLTPRQHQVLMLISNEYTTEEIARELGLAVGTIEVHRKALFQKFKVRNVAGLVKKACLSGFFKNEEVK